MTIIQLRCFVEVAQELNYAKAASNLFISQPAVSRHIISLENDLGVQLFVRSRHHVALTSAGNLFYSEAKDILERIDLSKHSILSNPGEETLNVGCVSSIRIDGLSKIYAKYHAKMPHVCINNTEITAGDYRRVSSGDHLDVAFVPSSLKGHLSYKEASLNYYTLYRGTLCCVMRADHRLVSKERITFHDLQGETLILLDHEHCPPSMDAVQIEIRKNAEKIKYYYSGSSLYSIPMIIGGLGLAIMPDFVCPKSDEIILRPFDLPAQLEFGIICRNNDNSALVRTFIDVAREEYRSLQK